MALILNLETATTVCSVAIAKNGQLLSLKEINGDYTHAENLTGFIEHVFHESGMSLKDLDAISISKGPGSYTGLRIGVSTAKGLCYSLDKPLIAINTLEHSAYGCSIKNGSADALFCPMIDARRMEVYCAVYDKANNLIRPTTAEIIDEHSFTELLENQPVYFFGDGAEKCKPLFATTRASAARKRSRSPTRAAAASPSAWPASSTPTAPAWTPTTAASSATWWCRACAAHR